jgi:hypothetical protein
MPRPLRTKSALADILMWALYFHNRRATLAKNLQGEGNAQSMDQRGICPGACATARPSLGAAARSNHCGRL